MKPSEADQRKIFVIRNPETLAAIGWSDPNRRNISRFATSSPHLQEIEQQAELAEKVEAQVRSPFQRDIIKLFERLTLYHRLENSVEVAGTKDFKSADRRSAEEHPSVADPDEQRDQRGGVAEPRVSRRDRLLFSDPAFSA